MGVNLVQVRDAKVPVRLGPRAPSTSLGEGTHGPMVPAGSSPHPSLTEEEDSQTELLIAEEKLSPEQEGQLMPR